MASHCFHWYFCVMPKGDYDSSVTYEMLDLVKHNGTSWLAKKEVTGIEPTVENIEYWQNMFDAEAFVDARIETKKNRIILGKPFIMRFVRMVGVAGQRQNKGRLCFDLLAQTQHATFILPFRIESRSAYLLGCKRSRNGSLSLPTLAVRVQAPPLKKELPAK